MKHLVIVDGFHFLFRAYHAVRPLTRSDGTHTNALYGFTQMLIKVVKDLNPDLCAVALDCSPTFRHELYPEYKANRAEMDEDMKVQMPFVEPLIAAFDIESIRVEGFEADDVIATLAKKYAGAYKITIVSSDKDLLQLVGGNVAMFDSMKDRTLDAEYCFEKFGVGPDKVTQVQALIGDSSDNIPGVRSVGPKTAAQLIGEFDSLENLYAHLDDVKRDKLREALKEHKDSAFLSYELVKLRQDVPIDCGENELSFHPDISGAADYLKNELEFNTLAKRLEKGKAKKQEPQPMAPTSQKHTVQTLDATYETVDTEEALKKWVQLIQKYKKFAIDTETTSLDAMQAELVGISLAVEEHGGCYIPLSHKGDMLLGVPKQLPKEMVFEVLKPLLLDESIRKIGQNIKYDLHILHSVGLEVVNVDDTMVMSFCLDGGLHGHGMDFLAEYHLDHTCIPYKEVCGTGKSQITFDDVPIEAATKYAAEDADITLRLYNLFEKRLDEEKNAGVKKLYETVEKPLIPTLTRVEENGVCINRQALEKLSLEFESLLKVYEEKIHQLAGRAFNINSPKQLAEILFDELKLPKKGKSRSTNVNVLEKFAEQEYEIAREILNYRSISKLKSTYADALVKVINPKTGRVHTSYNQTGAATGRFSSSDPNLQNIPIRSENGRKIRHCFIPAKGCQLMCADYSQIELRLLAHLSGSEALQQAFIEGHDIHAFTAHQIFDVPQAEVTSSQRSAAKAINFGLVYGMGEVSLSKHIGVSRQEAKEYIESYFGRYGGVRSYLETYKEFAREHGYVETMFGRRIHVPGVFDKMPMIKAGAERAAINAPLQGANADIIKMVMPKIEKSLQDKALKTKMLLQVHDELVFEVPDEEIDAVKELVRDLMSGVVKLAVPLEVGIGVADNWEDAH